MDELDLKNLRSLISERVVSPSNPSVKLSLSYRSTSWCIHNGRRSEVLGVGKVAT